MLPPSPASVPCDSSVETTDPQTCSSSHLRAVRSLSFAAVDIRLFVTILPLAQLRLLQESRPEGDGGTRVVDLIDASGLFLRIVSIRFQPDSIDAAMERFRTVSSPLVRKQPGSTGIFGGGNRDTGSTYSISIWQTHEDLENSNAVPEVVEAMAGYAQWMAGHFVVESFEIVSGHVIASSLDTGDRLWCRISSATALPYQIPAALDAVASRLERVASLSTHCLGTTLLSPLVGSKVVAFEYWSDPAALAASEPRAVTLDQRLSRTGLLQSPVVRDTVEVLEVS